MDEFARWQQSSMLTFGLWNISRLGVVSPESRGKLGVCSFVGTSEGCSRVFLVMFSHLEFVDWSDGFGCALWENW